MRSAFALFVLGGLSLGVIITAVVMTQQQELALAEAQVQHEARVERLISNYQLQLDALEDVDEACAELFERNIELEVKVIELEGVAIRTEINCLWRLHHAEKEQCPNSVGFATTEEMAELLEHLEACCGLCGPACADRVACQNVRDLK